MTYSIKDVSQILGLSIYTIRFYDKKGLLPFVSRNKSGNREFTESDLNLFKVICCLKNSGMQIKDIKKYIDFCMEGASTIDARKKILLEHRKEIMQQMEELNKNLEIVDFKIEIYESPNAIEIINEQRKQAYEEKRENKLLQTAKGGNICG
ncbi:MerR family transcriptional regulator [Clostridium sp. WILCCON 0269]|uniref:MerR family transcriptional regulator n=1 Tax=Candidatus Clostridium eludens TaxID=3381663 RepID=A0ABW8SNI7_9CLOT